MYYAVIVSNTQLTINQPDLIEMYAKNNATRAYNNSTGML